MCVALATAPLKSDYGDETQAALLLWVVCRRPIVLHRDRIVGWIARLTTQMYDVPRCAKPFSVLYHALRYNMRALLCCNCVVACNVYGIVWDTEVARFS